MSFLNLAVAMKSCIITSFLFSSLFLTVQSALPSSWKICSKDLPDREKCLQDSINGAIKSLISGNRNLGVLPLDPFEIGKVHTKGDSNGPVALDVHFKNFVIHNLRNFEVTSVEMKGRTLKLRGIIPGQLTAESPYTVTGKILMLPLTGDGPSNFTFWNGTFTFDLTFRKEPEVRDGKKYLLVEKLVERSHPQKLEIYLGNLFNGNKQLGDTMNKVLNENWELVWNELKPLFEDALSEAYRQLSNRVFSKIPMDDIGLF